ncbi:MAG: sigma-70 family RNA polymerase sigma factor [Planctomycetota bacterium]
MQDDSLGSDGPSPELSDTGTASGPNPVSKEDVSSLDSQLRALARALVHDEHTADDAVQDAWAAILERPPKDVESTPSWLKQVLRHRVAAILRRRSLGDHVEQRFAEDRRVTDRDSADQLESTKHLLHGAIGELAEPYRTVLQRRFVLDEAIAEISRALQRSEGTVRSQLSRGVAELRRVLDRKYGGRSSWTALVFPLAGLSPRAVKVTSLAGSQLVPWTALTALALFTLLGAIWWVKRDLVAGPEKSLVYETAQISDPESKDVPAPVEAVQFERPDRTLANDSTTPSATTAAAAEPSSEVPAPPERDLGTEVLATVRIELRDPAGMLSRRPVVEFRDAHRLARREAFSDNPFDLEIHRRDTIEAKGLRTLLAVSAEDEARSPTVIIDLKKLTGKTLSMVTRGPSSEVKFSVVDEEGDAVAGAVILLGPKGVHGVEVHDEYLVGHIGTQVVTDESGVAWITSAPREIRTLRVEARGYSMLERDLVLEKPQELVPVKLQAGAELRGSIRGPAGEPLAGVRVSVVEEAPLMTRARRVETFTDANGDYVLGGIDRRSCHVFAEWSGDAGQRDPPLVDSTVVDPTGTNDLIWDARPVPHYGLTLRFKDELGRPFGNVFAMIAPAGAGESAPPFISMLRTDADGTVHFPLVPDLPVFVRLERGHNGEFETKRTFRPATRKAEIIDLVVPRKAERGASVDGTLLLTSETSATPAQVVALRGQDRIYVDVDPGSGRFAFEDLVADTYDITVLWAGLGNMDLGSITLASGQHRSLGDLRVPETVEVRVDWGATSPTDDEPWAVSRRFAEAGQEPLPTLIINDFRPSFRLLPGDYVLYSESKQRVVPLAIPNGVDSVDTVIPHR